MRMPDSVTEPQKGKEGIRDPMGWGDPGQSKNTSGRWGYSHEEVVQSGM